MTAQLALLALLAAADPGGSAAVPLGGSAAVPFGGSVAVPRAPDGESDDLAKVLAELEVRWHGDELSLAELAEQAGEAPAAAARTWAPWSAANEYRMELNDDARILLVLPDDQKRARKELELLDELCERFDALLPLPPGAEGEGRDEETAVLLQIEDTKDYGTAIAFLADGHPYLGPWSRDAGELAGFVLREPLVAAWIEKFPGRKEWDPQNELVNRGAQLLALRRFGSQPFWLEMGLAWHFEYAVLDTIYCYPYRNEFVWATEHGGWDGELQRGFKDRKKEPLTMEELADWKRGTFDGDAAPLGWGVVRFLAKHHPEALPALLEGMRQVILEKGRVTETDGEFTTWRLIPGFEPHPDDQAALLRDLVAEDVLERMSEYFRKGKRYKPPK